jgi:hypothetical protein
MQFAIIFLAKNWAGNLWLIANGNSGIGRVGTMCRKYSDYCSNNGSGDSPGTRDHCGYDERVPGSRTRGKTMFQRMTAGRISSETPVAGGTVAGLVFPAVSIPAESLFLSGVRGYEEG